MTDKQANHPSPPRQRWAICHCCEGSGQMENPAFSNGFTSSEWRDMDGDEQESYMAGSYDVACSNCRATGKVQVQDVASMSFAEKRALVQQRREAEWRAESARDYAAERRMEA